MGFVVGSELQAPQVRLHGFLAIGQVLLGLESLLVLGHLAQVVTTDSHSLCNGFEAQLLRTLFRAVRSRAGHAGQSAQVDAAAVGVSRLGYTVRSEHHFLVTGVRRFLVDFGECTTDGLDCVSIFHFCHFALAILVHELKHSLAKGTRMPSLLTRTIASLAVLVSWRAPLSQMRGEKGE